MRTALFLGAALLVACLPHAPAADDIQMLPTRLKLDSTKTREQNNTTVEAKEIAYSVAVTSRSFKELRDVTVRYNIFYASSDFGAKSDPEIRASSGSHVFPALLTNKPDTFNTESIKLESATLDAGWYFKSGASSQSKDKVVGIWLKAFDASGQLIGEYINPPTLTKKQNWRE